MSSGNGDASLSLFGRLVDGPILEKTGKALLGLSLGDGGRQSRLPAKHMLTIFNSCLWHSLLKIANLSVIDMTDCANVDVGF